ncbi:GTP-binding protein [Cohnella sp. CFH 77786]|uniref:CobW family GTP-binding protein n=1 Tax=Cohnella sp. CFH 77786 TaxID=2662265 RepID=UPI001C6081A6|nr:CobW family GTP-binding protein [Cohnella sp. CFH 77786]MBW5448126.1 GTP-binding protein [Cohnella sp. CFH 77786]
MNDKMIPVYVLTGFLGSGKTTLLRRLIDDARERGWKPAVLMNEVGDVNLDGMLVDAEVPMAEMLGGCICCTIRGDLGLELMQLAEEYAPDLIWIESTGVAEPMEIIDAVTDASLYGKLELKGVVTVVDARHLLDRMRIGTGKTYRLMRDQIRAATVVLLNKTDLVAGAERLELEERMADWNAGAVLVPTVHSEVDPDRIYGSRVVRKSDKALDRHADGHAHGDKQDYEQVNEYGHDRDQEHSHENDHKQDHEHDYEQGHEHGHERGHELVGHEHAHGHEYHHGHSHVNVLTHYLDGPLDSRAFESFIQRLPEGVYRAKGIVSFRDTANRYLFQYAYRQSDFLPIRPQKPVYDVLVFIGEDYDKSAIESELTRLVDDSASPIGKETSE